MCSDPKIFDGFETSCRECNECCATYKNTWVSRCIAELKTHPHALAFTLTYADVDGRPPLGARVYRYKDVSDMWKRLRMAGQRKYGRDFVLRYVVVGEKGTRRGRCHYHGVMFSNYSIKGLGKFTSPIKKHKNEFALKRRLNWSSWGHGFVEFQEADRKGISYVLKYILKARMTDARSVGTAREGKTEFLASSYLWCSKKPAIGAFWLWDKLYRMRSKGMVPNKLRMPIGGGGEWYISGKLQKEVCHFIAVANEAHERSHGFSIAGFNQLVESVAEPIQLESGEFVPRKPWEYLTNVNFEAQQAQEEQQRIERVQLALPDEREQFERLVKVRREASARTTIARRCFGVRSCKTCEGFRTAEQIAGDAQVENFWREAYYREVNRDPLEKSPSFADWISRQGLVSEGCLDQKYCQGESFLEQSEKHRKAHEALERVQRAAR